MLVIIGLTLAIIQALLYITSAYGLFLVSLALQIFYCIVCPFTLKNSLHGKTTNTYLK
jgi:hypothetical protein